MKKMTALGENKIRLENISDLADLLNDLLKNKKGDNEKSAFFTEEKIKTIFQQIKNGIAYKTHYIPKKDGGSRKISVPINDLKLIHQLLLPLFTLLIKPSEQAMAFVEKRSILTNAQKHKKKKFVYNIDLEDFFHSVKHEKVASYFGYFLESENAGKLLADFCTAPINNAKIKNTNSNKDWGLPQGAPTSPFISNIVCLNLDSKLETLAKRYNATYSRYADDITFSSNNNIYHFQNDFINELKLILKQEGFKIKPTKTRLQKNGYRKEVTGLVVSHKVNVPKRFIKKIRMALYYWERYGYEKASKYFIFQYENDKGAAADNDATMQNILDGKLHFLKMVRGKKDPCYLKLRKRFDDLNKLNK